MKKDKIVLQSELNTTYLKKKIVSKLPTSYNEITFTDGQSKFVTVSRCTASVDENDNYQKIVSGPNAAHVYAFAYLDISKYINNSRKMTIEFDTKMGADRWYIGLSNLEGRPFNSSRDTYDTAGVVFSQGTKDGVRYYVNGTNTWKTTFFNKWVHSKISINFDTKIITYVISNGNNSDDIAGEVGFIDSSVEFITGIEVYSYVNSVEMGINNIEITSHDNIIDEQTIYFVKDGDDYSEYIYIDDSPHKIGSSLANIGTSNTDTTSDLNSLTTNGFYSVCANGQTDAQNRHFPLLDNGTYETEGTIIVCENFDGITQLFINYAVDNGVESTEAFVAMRTLTAYDWSIDSDWKFIKANQNSSNNEIVKYDTTPQQIGTWIDGTPVWRLAFNELFDGMVATDLSCSVDIPFTHYDNCFIISAFGMAKSNEEPCIIDDYPLERDFSGNSTGLVFVVPEGIAQKCVGYYGYVDFVTPESNVYLS